MKLHELKLQQPFFDDVYYNRKDFEVRKNDRDFKVGDRIKLIEYPSENPKCVLKDIKYILDGGQHGIESGYVVLGLKDVPNVEPSAEIINNEANTLLYTVRIICWDGIEYTREATKEEIDMQRKNGYVKGDGYSGITFDFRSSHGV